MKILCINCGSSSVKEALFEDERQIHQGEPDAIGHRIVHGGPSLTAPTLINDQVLDTLTKWAPYAPLHLPKELMAIDSCKLKYPGVPQVACFDTAFHAKLPRTSKQYPLPARYYEEGVHKYGFHGLSYEYITTTLPLPGRVIIAHLGSGCSLAAIKDGTPIDTTMGFTPLGGCMMATRPGDLDPGVLLHIMRLEGKTVDDMDQMLNFESGLLGVSEKSSDMKELLKDENSFAVELFCSSVLKQIGALTAQLQGLDHLIFTAGIGENAPTIRENICAKLAYLGDFEVHVLRTNEDLMIARHTKRVISGL